MKVCTKLRLPIGPSSPAHDIPATAPRPTWSCTSRASWSGSPKRWLPRPLQVNTSAAANKGALGIEPGASGYMSGSAGAGLQIGIRSSLGGVP